MAKKKQTKKSTTNKKSEPLSDKVVFAFRLTKEERDLIHQAAGPRGASRFVLEAALAAAASAKPQK